MSIAEQLIDQVVEGDLTEVSGEKTVQSIEDLIGGTYDYAYTSIKQLKSGKLVINAQTKKDAVGISNAISDDMEFSTEIKGKKVFVTV